MLKTEYIQQVKEILNNLSTTVSAKIKVLFENIPTGTQQLDIVISISDELDGYFQIFASVSGQNLYVLNKQIEPYSQILATEHTEIGFQPNFPMVNNNCIDFQLDNVLAELVSTWLNKLILALDYQSIKLPIIISDDYSGFTYFTYNME